MAGWPLPLTRKVFITRLKLRPSLIPSPPFVETRPCSKTGWWTYYHFIRNTPWGVVGCVCKYMLTSLCMHFSGRRGRRAPLVSWLLPLLKPLTGKIRNQENSKFVVRSRARLEPFPPTPEGCFLPPRGWLRCTAIDRVWKVGGGGASVARGVVSAFPAS